MTHGSVLEGLSNVVAISATGEYGLALKSDGTVVGLLGARVPAGLSNVTAIVAGASGLAGSKPARLPKRRSRRLTEPRSAPMLPSREHTSRCKIENRKSLRGPHELALV
jgi:hypothetical protein